MGEFSEGFKKGYRKHSRRNRNIIPFLVWLGGAVHVYNLPGYGFWDAIIWLYYVGRYIAIHFTTM